MRIGIVATVWCPNSGEDGLDTLIGGGSADEFMIEDSTAFNDEDIDSELNAGDGDSLNIEYILDGYYGYGIDTLTDSRDDRRRRTDSALAIDQDGGADNFVARL